MSIERVKRERKSGPEEILDEFEHLKIQEAYFIKCSRKALVYIWASQVAQW